MLIVFTPLICFCSILDSNAVTVDAVNFVCIWIGVCDRFTTLPTPPPQSSSMQCKEYILISLYFYLVPLILISLFHSTQLFIFSSFRCCFFLFLLYFDSSLIALQSLSCLDVCSKFCLFFALFLSVYNAGHMQTKILP